MLLLLVRTSQRYQDCLLKAGHPLVEYLVNRDVVWLLGVDICLFVIHSWLSLIPRTEYLVGGSAPQ
jgi:hypothetical protein